MEFLDFLNGWGTEISLSTALILFLRYVIKKGIFKKIKIWVNIKIGNGKPNTSGSPWLTTNPSSSGNPGHPCDTHTEAIKNIKKEFAEFKSNNRDDHKNMFDKIEDIWKSLLK